MKIYKYVLSNNTESTLKLPKNAKILSVQEQNEKVVLWVLVDPYAELEEVNFHIFGTGWDIDSSVLNMEHIGTWQSTVFVWHLFREK